MVIPEIKGKKRRKTVFEDLDSESESDRESSTEHQPSHSRRRRGRFANDSEISIAIDASNEEIRHECALEKRLSLEGSESSEASEASSPGVTESPGVTGNVPRRSGRVRAESHRYSSSEHSKQVHLQHNKGENKFYNVDEAKILAISMCQIEIQ